MKVDWRMRTQNFHFAPQHLNLFRVPSHIHPTIFLEDRNEVVIEEINRAHRLEFAHELALTAKECELYSAHS
jgi:hypothetical protein